MKVGLPNSNWNEIVGAQGGHFLQSLEWAQFQVALGREVLWAESPAWSWIGTLREVSGFRYLYLAYGPTVVDGTLNKALESVVVAAKEYNADFVRIEPIGVSDLDLKKSGFKLEPIEEIEPTATSIIDLGLSEEELRHNLTSGHRSAINAAERRGIKVRLAGLGEINEFNRLINMTAQKAGIRVHTKTYFEAMFATLEQLKAARLYLAEADGTVVAATIIFTTGSTWYYAHAASDPAYSKLQAGVPLLWRVILDAKSSGAKEFDLWGVVQGNDQGPKAGYSKFKRAFGGSDKIYAGTWDVAVNPLRYRLFKLARKGSRVLRRVRR